MAIDRVVCPECRASLKCGTPDGFAVGETIECPKCGTYFAAEPPKAAPPVAAKPASKPRVVVEEDEDDRPRPKKARPRAVEEDDEDDRPRRKKARRRDDDEDDDDYDDRPRKKKKKDEGSYKSSPIRFAILGILVVIMLVLAYFLYRKWEREKQDASVAPVGQVA